MNIVRTNIKVDAAELLGIYRQLQTEHKEYLMNSDLPPAKNKEVIFPGSSVHGIRFQGIEGLSAHDEAEIFEKGDSRTQFFTMRNEKCVGYLNDVLDFFADARRGSFWTMDPGFSYQPHTDKPSDVCRLHVALATNPFCHLSFGDGETCHVPVDGHVWLIRTRVTHTAWNMGKTPRTHMLIKLPEKRWDYYANHTAVI